MRPTHGWLADGRRGASQGGGGRARRRRGRVIHPTRPGATDGREPPAGHVGSDGHLADGRRLLVVGGWVGGWVVMGGCAQSLRPGLAVVLPARRPTHDAQAHIQHAGQARTRTRDVSASTSQPAEPAEPAEPSHRVPAQPRPRPRSAARPRASHLFLFIYLRICPQKTPSNSRAEKPSPSDADKVFFFFGFPPARARARTGKDLRMARQITPSPAFCMVTSR